MLLLLPSLLMNRCVDAVENPELVTNCELEWVKIQLKDRKELLIGSFYMPHQNMEDYFHHCSLYFIVLCVLIYCHGVPIYVGAVEIAC
jgi:hypothetical protein